jgi:Signal transduction histidine kinase
MQGKTDAAGGRPQRFLGRSVPGGFEVTPRLFWGAASAVTLGLACAIVADLSEDGIWQLALVDAPALAAVVLTCIFVRRRGWDLMRAISVAAFVTMADLLGSLLMTLLVGAPDISQATLMTMLVLSMILGASGFYFVKSSVFIFGSSMLLAFAVVCILTRDRYLLTTAWYLLPAMVAFILIFYYSRKALEELVRGLHDAEARLTAQNEQLESASALLRQKNADLELSIEAAERAKEKAEAASREKELLLHEIHHRVKNNYQVIISMLNLQAGAKAAGGERTSFAEATERIRSMAMVHEILYESDNLSSLDFADYIRRIGNNVINPDGRRAILELELEPLQIELDRAMPCGLIVTEALINALKHGRGEDGCARVSVSLAGGRDGAVLEIADGGRGFPSAGPERDSSFGMSLMSALAFQAGGEISFENRSAEGGSKGETGGARVRLVLK